MSDFAYAGMARHGRSYFWLWRWPVKSLPVLSTVPRSGTWFLRYAISFLSHLDQGGRIDDRLTGEISGPASGTAFDFHRFRGGPLFRVRSTMPRDHLFIGHTVCPGFADAASLFPWWSRTAFHVPGYDYLHEGLNYDYTPVDLAPYEYTRVSVQALEQASSAGRGDGAALVYRNPVSQAASYFRYCASNVNPAYNTYEGRPLADVPFRDYLLGSALPSYAKQFVSFQAMAARHPGRVLLVPYEHLLARPEEALSDLLDHLSGTSGRDRPNLPRALRLARREHLRAIEVELGHSLDGTRAANGSHMRQGDLGLRLDDRIRDQAISRLQTMGIDVDLFAWSAVKDLEDFPSQAMAVAAE